MNGIVLLAAIACALLLAGFVYQWAGSRSDRKQYAADGRWVDIGEGNKIYLFEKGAGNPVVLFEAGITATNLNWRNIQTVVAQSTSTVAYDRIGLGWSSPARTARTPAHIADELHKMLQRASIPPPYILVGHSFGGLVLRRFAATHPETVAGVILVDPMRCDEWPPLNPAKQFMINRGRRLSACAIPFAQFGVVRLAVKSLLGRSGQVSGHLAGAAGPGGRHVLSRVKEEVGKLPKEVWPVVASHWSRPAYYVGMNQYIKSVPATVRQMQQADPIQDIPVVVLTPAKSTPLSETCLQSIGNHVRQVIAPRSAHWIHLDEPDLVIETIQQMVETAAHSRDAVIV